MLLITSMIRKVYDLLLAYCNSNRQAMFYINIIIGRWGRREGSPALLLYRFYRGCHRINYSFYVFFVVPIRQRDVRRQGRLSVFFYITLTVNLWLNNWRNWVRVFAQNRTCFSHYDKKGYTLDMQILHQIILGTSIYTKDMYLVCRHVI